MTEVPPRPTRLSGAVIRRPLSRLLATTLATTLATAVMAAVAPGAAAQGLKLMSDQGSGPLEIDAETTLEWWRDSNSYVATGNARAKRGQVTLYAQTLRAFYREGPNGGNEIHRIEAEGEVRIVSPTERAQGDFGVYDVTAGRLELTGNDLRLETPTDVVTARDSLVYDERKLEAVATGDASAVRADRRIHAEILTAYLQDKGSNLEIRKVDAEQNVCVQSARAVARGRRGTYNVSAGKAVLSNGVEIVQEGNVLTGDVADVDLNTGISRLRAAPARQQQEERRRIKAILPMAGDPGSGNASMPNQSTSLPARMRSCR